MNGIKDGSNTIRVSLSDGALNYCFKTTDYGTTWISEPLPSAGQTNGLQDMEFINANLGFAGGNLGTFMRYGTPSGITSLNNEIPDGFSLSQNYPNPFNPTTNLEFGVRESGFVSLKIFNSLGMEVATLVNENKAAGNYKVTFNGSNLSSGIYFYTLETGSFKETKRMNLIK